MTLYLGVVALLYAQKKKNLGKAVVKATCTAIPTEIRVLYISMHLTVN